MQLYMKEKQLTVCTYLHKEKIWNILFLAFLHWWYP